MEIFLLYYLDFNHLIERKVCRSKNDVLLFQKEFADGNCRDIF